MQVSDHNVLKLCLNRQPLHTLLEAGYNNIQINFRCETGDGWLNLYELLNLPFKFVTLNDNKFLGQGKSEGFVL
jgi:hypothetical protein